MLRLVVLVALAGLCRADLPIDCRFSDAVGTWIVSESARTGDPSLDCSGELGEVVHQKQFTLTYPNLVTDELGNTGTWTLIYNQGFEVNINERSYWANFAYNSSGFWCDHLHVGWARDTTVRHWSCFSAVKATFKGLSAPRKYHVPVLRNPDEFFRNNKAFIRRINEAQTSWTAKAYPHFERYTNREMLQRAGGFYSPLPPPKPTTKEELSRAALLPSHFDWRDVEGVNYVSPVRDQGNCGSCYAFASTALLESRVRILTNNSRQDIFSPQEVVSCSRLSEGCNGGFAYLIAGRYAKDIGFVNESCNFYFGGESECSTDPSCARTYVSRYAFVGGYYGGANEALMMEALVKEGPIAVDFNVESDFSGYHQGIYVHLPAVKRDFDPVYTVNHVVLVVGYGVDEASGMKYWIVKNSWGQDWGEQGYFRIRRGTNENWQALNIITNFSLQLSVTLRFSIRLSISNDLSLTICFSIIFSIILSNSITSAASASTKFKVPEPQNEPDLNYEHETEYGMLGE
ncbi:dipeptidyl peptidase 1 [Hyalella azteca]|uniref:Dipeptidyl peptidase 1 n=1 Tax=Hyalella azteca TaxID=294128 RepID=A0A979FGY5_HYAAZ|nr:dipeptidyl peptidase 1 [Hyalella azteca]